MRHISNLRQNMTPMDILIYYLSWMIPSSTLIYIILHDKYKYGRIPSYIIANFIAGTAMLPINYYIFGRL
jgi:hypothetical protein